MFSKNASADAAPVRPTLFSRLRAASRAAPAVLTARLRGLSHAGQARRASPQASPAVLSVFKNLGLGSWMLRAPAPVSHAVPPAASTLQSQLAAQAAARAARAERGEAAGGGQGQLLGFGQGASNQGSHGLHQPFGRDAW